jgi:hypothetical protein
MMADSDLCGVTGRSESPPLSSSKARCLVMAVHSHAGLIAMAVGHLAIKWERQIKGLPSYPRASCEHTNN